MKIHVLIILMVAISACVKKRPVERHQDFDDFRWQKSVVETQRPWLARVTVVNNGLNSTFGFVGLQNEARLGHFEITKTHLRFVELKTDYSDSDSTDRLINSWRITHTDLHRKVVNGRKSNVETENNEIPWDEKRYFKVDWSSAEVKERSTFPYGIPSSCATPTSTQLVDGQQEVTPQHIGFVVAVTYLLDRRCLDERGRHNNDLTLTIHYKYSFMPEPDLDGYEPYVYTGEDDPLKEKYGYFNTSFLRYDENRQSQSIFFMNRWNPNKTHTFYFAPGFPEEYKWIYTNPTHGVFARTNQLFESNGLPIRFRIEENDGTKRFGDIRYSFIHFIDTPDLGAPFGFGPSTVNPRTGEIISANSVIWTHDMKFYVQRMRDRAEIPPGESSLISKMEEVIGQDESEWGLSAEFLGNPSFAEAFRYMLPEFTYELPGSAFARHDSPLSFDSLSRALENSVLANSETAEWKHLIEQANNTLEDARDMVKLREYYNNPTGIAVRTDLSDEFLGGFSSIDFSDEQKIIDDILYQVAIHEFGHNLNLRHNFYGTIDATLDLHHDESAHVTSHSVMDYARFEEQIGQPYDWGAYDKAALLYSYSNGRIDPARSRQAPYLFCTDHHTVFNPMCNRFDSGASPSEVIRSHIRAYDEGYWFRNFRSNRVFWNPGSSYGGMMFQTMFELKKMIRFYEQAFQANQVEQIMERYPILNQAETDLFVEAVRNDLETAVALAVSFYRSVIQQRNVDRPFIDRYNSANGSLSQLGISTDKFFASLFLFGDDGFPLDPNRGVNPASLLQLRGSSPALSNFVNAQLADVFVEGGEMYAGFSDLIRSLYVSTAARNYDLTGNINELMPMRVTCYSLNSFSTRFGVPASAIGQQPFEINNFDVALNPEFQGEDSIIALRVGDIVLAAGRQLNPLSAGVLLDDDKSGGRRLGSMYQRIVYNRQSLSCE